MSYATQQDLIDRFGSAELIELTDRDGQAPDAIDATVVARALTDADETIDGYLQAASIKLPLSSVPALVKRWAIDIARYFLHAQAPTETVRRNYEDALKALRDVAAGKIRLQVEGVDAEPSSNAVQVDAPERTFTRETLTEF